MMSSRVLRLLLLSLSAVGLACGGPDEAPRVLVFTKTEGYRPGSTDAGLAVLEDMARRNGIAVDVSDDAAAFTEAHLAGYRAVVFLNTTGDVLDPYQQNAFERFVQAGGGYVGIHAAAAAEPDWPWYHRLVGTRLAGPEAIPAAAPATVRPASAREGMPDTWTATDRWPAYGAVEPGVEVLLTSEDGAPLAWRHAFEGGRAFYTGGGGTPQSFADERFLHHLERGLLYAAGDAAVDFGRARTPSMPDETRFKKVVLAENLNEPTELEILPDERILFLERRGNVRLYDPAVDSVRTVTRFEVNSTFEDGLLGLALDPDYPTNSWLYIYYSPPDTSLNRLSRFTFDGDVLDPSSEVVLLEVGTQREECCHTGGSLEFGPDGALFLSTGDNTNPFHSNGYGPIDERPGRAPFDGQTGPANTNDLRGKILRIVPQPDGSYAIPEGNLFPPGTPDTRPEIYVMGNRNPYRISVDPETGFLYWGEVGPDAGENDSLRGPRGYDEINQARAAGFFGWPYFVGDNQAYGDHDFATGTTGSFFDPARPVNDSPHNTGLRELPPAQPAFIWYPYAASPEFPIVGAGGRTAMAGPVFHSDRYHGSPTAFPAYYDGKLFIYEWMRDWILVATMDDAGDLLGLEPFMPSTAFSKPMDMAFAPNGVMYLLEYGRQWNQQNPDARLVRIEYYGGNRTPVARLAADRTVGRAPLTVTLSGEASTDADGEPLAFAWTAGDGTETAASGATATFTYDRPGIYRPRLTVTDADGRSDSAELEVRVGNEPPALAIDIEGNRSFFWEGRTVRYAVEVTDAEDGSLRDGGIEPEAVRVSADYLEEGFDRTLFEQGHGAATAAPTVGRGARLIETGDCRACHATDRPSVGPSYLDVARRYRDDEEAVPRLASKIISGGGGVWGEQVMVAHPQLSLEDATAVVRHILSLADDETAAGLPASGSVAAGPPAGTESNTDGTFLLKASYMDRGSGEAGPLSAQEVHVLRHPRVQAETFDAAHNVGTWSREGEPAWITDLFEGSHVAFTGIDLTGIEALTVRVSADARRHAGGRIEVRLDGPDGRLVGEADVPAADGESAERDVAVDLQRVDAVHDVYLVFRSPDAADPRAVFMIDWILFHPTPGA